jgi:hypothetical protein
MEKLAKLGQYFMAYAKAQTAFFLCLSSYSFLKEIERNHTDPACLQFTHSTCSVSLSLSFSLSLYSDSLSLSLETWEERHAVTRRM